MRLIGLDGSGGVGGLRSTIGISLTNSTSSLLLLLSLLNSSMMALWLDGRALDDGCGGGDGGGTGDASSFFIGASWATIKSTAAAGSGAGNRVSLDVAANSVWFCWLADDDGADADGGREGD